VFPYRDKIIFRNTAATQRKMGHNSRKLCGGELPSVRVIMGRLYLYFRLLAVVLTFPVVVVYIAIATLVHPITAIRNRFRTALRIWMSVLDWIKGIPVGYSYWEQYEAPSMLDEIAVHHDE